MPVKIKNRSDRIIINCKRFGKKGVYFTAINASIGSRLYGETKNKP